MVTMIVICKFELSVPNPPQDRYFFIISRSPWSLLISGTNTRINLFNLCWGSTNHSHQFARMWSQYAPTLSDLIRNSIFTIYWLIESENQSPRELERADFHDESTPLQLVLPTQLLPHYIPPAINHQYRRNLGRNIAELGTIYGRRAGGIL